MKPSLETFRAPVAEDLTEMQLRVARRADLLARREPPGPAARDRRLWLRAECEIFELSEIAENSGGRLPATPGGGRTVAGS